MLLTGPHMLYEAYEPQSFEEETEAYRLCR